MKILILGPVRRNANIKNLLTSHGNDVSISTAEITLEHLIKDDTDWIVSSGYAPIIKEPIISKYKNRIINLHNSMLPYGKGIYPNLWSFIEGTPSGVSIHYIDSGIDTGDIIVQKEVMFSTGDTLKTSHDKLMIELDNLFCENWDAIINNSCELIRQKSLITNIRYHNRVESERVLDLLPGKWDTPIVDVEKMGADMSLSKQYFEKYDEECI
mgnify:CR=1 FL=1|jgi:folate-dependent phosphoribosylglycinamide formyltransferase PurN